MTEEIDKRWTGDAKLSSCLTYRYWLERHAPGCENEPYILWELLNPSTADDERNDPTSRRVQGFTVDIGWSRFIITNPFAYRTSKPKDLWEADDELIDIVGPNNVLVREQLMRNAGMVICGWGAELDDAEQRSIFAQYKRWGVQPHALKLNGDGSPGHPLYLPKTLRPFPLEMR